MFYYCTNTVTIIHKNVEITQRNNQIKRNNSGTINITTKNNSYSENNEQSTLKIQMWVESFLLRDSYYFCKKDHKEGKYQVINKINSWI